MSNHLLIKNRCGYFFKFCQIWLLIILKCLDVLCITTNSFFLITLCIITKQTYANYSAITLIFYSIFCSNSKLNKILELNSPGKRMVNHFTKGSLIIQTNKRSFASLIIINGLNRLATCLIVEILHYHCTVQIYISNQRSLCLRKDVGKSVLSYIGRERNTYVNSNVIRTNQEFSVYNSDSKWIFHGVIQIHSGYSFLYGA